MHVLNHIQTIRTDSLVKPAHVKQAHRNAFTSGSSPAAKRPVQHCAHVQRSRRASRSLIRATAATDTGTRAIQAIKKSVGGDVFVAGRHRTSACSADDVQLQAPAAIFKVVYLQAYS